MRVSKFDAVDLVLAIFWSRRDSCPYWYAFLLLNCSSWVADILMKSWIEKHYQGVNIKVWKDMRMNNILEKNFFCPWLIVTLVKEVFEQFTVGGTALRLSKFDIADLVLAIFWSRFWIILFFCSWHDYERTHSCHQSHQGVIRESSDINYTLIMFYEQNCVGRTSVSFSKFHSHCLAVAYFPLKNWLSSLVASFFFDVVIVYFF